VYTVVGTQSRRRGGPSAASAVSSSTSPSGWTGTIA